MSPASPRAWALVVTALCAVAPLARADSSGPCMASPLAPAILSGSGEQPELWLAQRSIDREWGPSEDSTYQVIDVKDWKSEGLSFALSAGVPGSGQLYVGEKSGWVFLLVEALAWTGRTLTLQRGDNDNATAAGLIGDPNDPAAPWSFERYSTSTGDNADALRTLWDQDRKAFYEALSNDSRYRAGFSSSNQETAFDEYHGTYQSSQTRYRYSHYFETAIWVNHVVAALDALRAARTHNLPLRRSMELQLTARPSLHGGQFRAVLATKF